ncbi:pfkB-like carbohydrate kinase family protein [Artemisia annua]|uniref:Ribokinase n=1 Tax=Artemisia annua TaxID=35608 RepID=A0A2U1LDB2_ARTAN|nr:pfkB-like carbohydrate kinase family protein [Artemisia annua]
MGSSSSSQKPDSTTQAGGNTDFKSVSDQEWKNKLTGEQFYVTRQKGTERAFTGYVSFFPINHCMLLACCVQNRQIGQIGRWVKMGRVGIETWNTGTPKLLGLTIAFVATLHYMIDTICGFLRSSTKFDSGTGWPSYYQPIGDNVKTKLDLSIIFMPRQEVVCAVCDAHLGHVFDDGPPPTGKRHCINRSQLHQITMPPSFSPSPPWQQSPTTTTKHSPSITPKPNTPNFLTTQSKHPKKKFQSLIANSKSVNTPPPLVVVGSANADIYVEITRLPSQGETISAKTGQTLAGGKGANQAVCSSMLSYPTYFVGQVGQDAHGELIIDALEKSGVCLDYLRKVEEEDVPTGHAVVMLQSDGQNSIIIVGGANMNGWEGNVVFKDGFDVVVRNAGIVLLQREIPDIVNIKVAKAAKSAGVPVILDAGGMDAPIPVDLLNNIDIFSPNESELARLTGMPTENFEQITLAVAECHKLGVRDVLVKLGDRGSALFTEGNEPIEQGIIKAEKVLDTTGAGDTFTAAYAVALVEGKSKVECLRFAAAAASLCVQVKGAIPSMPRRKAVLDLLQSI